MHYYERNIGDYHKKAGRLNILQHGVYNLLIDACYDHESFPTLEEAIDWVWAESEEEIDAVKLVLRRFFTCDENGRYIQNRIKEELDKYHAFCAKQAENGKKGGRPKKGNSDNDLGNSGFNNESQENPDETQNNPLETQKKPKPSNQQTIKPNKDICPPNGERPSEKNSSGNFKQEIQDVFDFWKTTFGKNDRTVLDNKRKAKIQARLRDGYTVEELKLAVVNCSKSDFHVSGNYTDIELICRDVTKTDSFISLSGNSAQKPAREQTQELDLSKCVPVPGDW